MARDYEGLIEQQDSSVLRALSDPSSPWYGLPYDVVSQWMNNAPAGFDAGMVPGQEIDAATLGKVLGRLNMPGWYEGIDNGMTLEQYLADPKSMIKVEDGKFVYRPEQSQGDFVSKDRESFMESLGALPFVLSAFAGPFMASLGATGAAGAGAMGSAAADFPTFMGDMAATGGSAAGAAGSGINALNSFDTGAMGKILGTTPSKLPGLGGLLGLESTGSAIGDKLLSTGINQVGSRVLNEIKPGAGSLVGLTNAGGKMDFDWTSLIGPVAGGLLGGLSSKGGGDSTSTQTTRSELPAFVQPYSQWLLAKAYEQASQPYEPYTGQRFATLGPEFDYGLQQQAGQAMANPINMSNTNMMTNTLMGNYLRPDSNPYLKDSVNTALGQAGSQVNSLFKGNNFGSSAHTETLGRTLGEVATNAYRQSYDAERQNQLRASSLAPSASASNYMDAEAMRNVAQMRRDENQRGLDFGYQQFQERKNYPYQQLGFMGSAIGQGMGNAGTTTTTGTTPNQGNMLTGLLGGAMTGYGLQRMIGGMMNQPKTQPDPWANWFSRP